MRFPRLTGLVVNLSVGLLLAAPALAAPPIWVVQGEQATVYLFGTIHLLPAGTEWRTEAFDEVFEQADAVWLEITDTHEGDPEIDALVSVHGVSPDRPLTSVLSEKDLALMEQALEPYSVSVTDVDHLRPWYAALMLSGLPLGLVGFDTAEGVDVVIEAEAEAAGKPLHAFETLEEQIMVLAGLSEEVQIAFLRETLREMPVAAELLLGQIEHWVEGDIGRIEDYTGEYGAVHPEVYEAMFTARNHRFADVIEKLLRGEGVVLAAFGVGHMVGEDSVPDILARRGHTVEVR